jgi:hypothetical protein
LNKLDEIAMHKAFGPHKLEPLDGHIEAEVEPVTLQKGPV